MPEEGNPLWQQYLKLPLLLQRELRAELEALGFKWSTFRQDTLKGRRLDLVPFGRLDAYRAFFEAHGLANLLDIARQERQDAHALTAA